MKDTREIIKEVLREILVGLEARKSDAELRSEIKIAAYKYADSVIGSFKSYSPLLLEAVTPHAIAFNDRIEELLK